MNIVAKTITMAPKVIFERAKKLRDNGEYEEALNLLQRNMVEADVYDDHIQMKIPLPEAETKIRRNRGFKKKPYYSLGDKGGGRKKRGM